MEMTPKNASELRDVYVLQLEVEHATFLNVVKALPDDRLSYKPDDRIMDFGTLARHIAGSGAFFSNTIQAGQTEKGTPPEPAPLPATTAALVQELEPMLRGSLAAYRALTPEQLARPIDFFGMGEHPGVHFIHWDIVHLVHHRAQLGIYLRLCGQKVPSIYGPTLDVTFDDLVSGV